NSAINAFNTAKNAGIKIKDITLVINKSKGGLDSDKLKLIEEAGLKIGAYIPFQDEIEKNSEKGDIVKTEIVSTRSSLSFASLLRECIGVAKRSSAQW
ncbi:MAG: hypothetical protein Q8N67_02850, partial [Candidatus Omnitrophota bacterium]|nr:hypothetical protein [Candidatus Omnitrophota bacterium]